MMVDPSAHPQHMNLLKLLVYVWSGCGDVGTIPCGSGASYNKVEHGMWKENLHPHLAKTAEDL